MFRYALYASTHKLAVDNLSVTADRFHTRQICPTGNSLAVCFRIVCLKLVGYALIQLPESVKAASCHSIGIGIGGQVCTQGIVSGFPGCLFGR